MKEEFQVCKSLINKSIFAMNHIIKNDYSTIDIAILKELEGSLSRVIKTLEKENSNG